MDERDKKAFEFAADIAKQLITLATGIIAVTITFSKDFVAKTPANAKPYALVAWCLFLLSIIGGIWTLMALTGTLGRLDKQDLSIYATNIRLPSYMQVLTFLGGLVLSVAFAWMSS